MCCHEVLEQAVLLVGERLDSGELMSQSEPWRRALRLDLALRRGEGGTGGHLAGTATAPDGSGYERLPEPRAPGLI